MNYNVDSLINLITETVREILNKSHIIPITELQNAANKSAAASSSSKNQNSENTVIIQLLNHIFYQH